MDEAFAARVVLINRIMQFESLYNELLTEMPVTSKLSRADLNKRVRERIPSGISSGHFSPLQKITNEADREGLIDEIIRAVFTEKENTYSSEIHSKEDFKGAIRSAMLAAKGKFGFKVNNTSAGFLADRLWTHLQDVLDFSAGADRSVAPKETVRTAVETAVEETGEVLGKEEPKEEPKETEMAAPAVDEINPDEEFVLPEEYYQGFVDRVEVINKRSGRYGLPRVTIMKVGEGMKEDKRDRGEERAGIEKVMRKFITFRLMVPQLKLEGDWEFVARVDHEPVGNIIVKIPNSSYKGDLHKLFGTSQASVCDHCHKVRTRTSTYVVKDSQGALKRIGKQCLRDYLPGGSNAAEKLQQFAKYIQELYQGLAVEIEQSGKKREGEEGVGGGRNEYYSVGSIALVGLVMMDAMGYTSASQARSNIEFGGANTVSTADEVKNYFATEFRNRDDVGAEKVKEIMRQDEKREEYEKKVSRFLDWAIEHTKKELADPNNKMRDFYANVDTIIGATKTDRTPADSYINVRKHGGYIVALVSRYKKFLEERAAQDVVGEKVSDYVGVEGLPIGELSAADKRKLKGSTIDQNKFPFNGPISVVVTANSAVQRQSFSYYDSGVSYRIGLVDDKGNMYTYFASSDPGFEVGEKTTIERAIVKKHSSFKDKKQTMITRVTFGDTAVKESVCPSFAKFFGRQ